MKNLIIVESPAKAKTIEKILGKNYKVLASYGHVRDLPKKILGVDVENDFEPKYVIPTKSRKNLNSLKKSFKTSDKVYLATDLDREGEAIAWHIIEAIKPPKELEIKRVIFPAITKNAVLEGMKNPRDIDLRLVDAQQARRVLDRLVGYKLSPLLWKKIFKGLSAGRVQSVALRLIVEREREIEAFKPEEYWTTEADFSKKTEKGLFRGKLINVDGVQFKPVNEEQGNKYVELIKNADYQVKNIESKERNRNPYAPFTTSTLQQEAYRKLRFGAKKTMLLAQKLYEGIELEDGRVGLITYMRTDSRNISNEALMEIRKYIEDDYGKEFLPDQPNIYKKQSKLVQEAHEAIRVTYPDRVPNSLAKHLDKDMFRLYELIWKRTISCQMKPAVFDLSIVDVEGENQHMFLFRANGVKIKSIGFLKVWDYKDALGEDVVLPPLEVKDGLDLIDLFVEQHFTKPPARYTEASLVKELEKNGVGRPSTYASIMSTIQTRGYVDKEEGKFVPKEVGVLVNDFLVKHFDEIVDIGFTAAMEDNLDKIALGEKKWVPVVRDYYLPLEKKIKEKEESINKEDVVGKEIIAEKCPTCGKDLIVKYSRFGKFVACTGFPDCKYTKPLEVSSDEAKLEQEAQPCEKCGGKMVLKKGRYGSFLACSNYPGCKNIRSVGKKTNVKCPKCKVGELEQRRSKKGRIFYGCNKYPDCDVAVWNEPTDNVCDKCGFVMTKTKNGKLKCEQCVRNAKSKN